MDTFVQLPPDHPENDQISKLGHAGRSLIKQRKNGKFPDEVPPAEAEANYHAALEAMPMAA